MTVPRLHGWSWALFTLELRKLLAYRVDFWLSFGGTLLLRMACGYFLWEAVFEAQGVDTIGGLSLNGMLLYFLIVSTTQSMIRGRDLGLAFNEIYSGAFTRYFFYPVPVLRYFGIRFAAQMCVGTQQLVIGILGFMLIFPFPNEVQLSIVSCLGGLIATFVGGFLAFLITSAIEYVAFWADNVWSLILLNQFISELLGGATIPLALFPAEHRTTLQLLPYNYIISFPVRTFLGQVSFEEWLIGLGAASIWILFFSLVARGVLELGRYRYTGVGM